MEVCMEPYQENYRSLKLVFLLLTSLLILTQFYFLSFKLPFELAFTQKSVGFFSIYLNKLSQSFALWPPLLLFIAAHIALQSLLAVVIYLLTKKLIELFPSLTRNIFLWGICLWLFCQGLIFFWNGLLFPYSFFALKFSWLQSYPNFFLILLSLMSLPIFILLVLVLWQHWRMTVSVLTLLLLFYLGNHFLFNRYFKAHASPNVIIIITDSLRPDFVFSNNPNSFSIENIVKRGAFFPNTFTLLGRSSPGLVSILTGNYPKTHGARFNLIPTKYINLENSLTKILQSKGYQTIFLADGRQFINLDNNYGFNQVITAKSGIYDFIFTFINDTPLSNLLTNTKVAQLLFPYNYANRNAYYTYRPHSFINLVDNKLINQAPSKPVLLVSALTIAHWPYVWARQPQLQNLEQRYQDSVTQLDQQFIELMQLFKSRGLLQNSIVVVLSDHGDSLGLPGDRIIQTQNYIGPQKYLNLIPQIPYTSPTNKLVGIDTSAGHGTDLLSMTQLNTTLAFNYPSVIKPQIIKERVALIDVTPTILDLLNIKMPLHFDGISLKPLMLGQANLAELNRPIFLETEIDIPMIDVTRLDGHRSAVSALIEQYANLYDIDLATQQLVLKDEAIQRLLSEKQLGVIDQNWLLAYFPGKNALNTQVLPVGDPEIKNCYYVFPAKTINNRVTDIFCYQLRPTSPYYVLVNLKTMEWQIFLNKETNDPIFKSLLDKLNAFF